MSLYVIIILQILEEASIPAGVLCCQGHPLLDTEASGGYSLPYLLWTRENNQHLLPENHLGWCFRLIRDH